MPVRPLSTNPSLENLRKQAKRLLEGARTGDAGALASVREFHPQGDASLAKFALHDAQLALARSYGFPSWTKLVHHLEGVASYAWDPNDTSGASSSAEDRFARLACLDYGVWRLADLPRARALLAESPGIPRASVYAAAAAGDVAAVREWIERDPALVSRAGGPCRWPPLLYACYSRFESDGLSTLAVARELLAAGADPDAGFLWCGNVPPFTALTGTFGEGEDGNNQPPHPERDALARSLLESGADPNDGQTLYNRHFRADDGHFELLLEYGLGTERGGPWIERFRERMGGPREILAEELRIAARKGFAARVRLLVAHSADLDAPGWRDGRTAYESAHFYGNHEIARYLAEHGARTQELSPQEAFESACVAGRKGEALAWLERHPELRHGSAREHRIELVRRAVEARHSDGVRLMASLGFELGPPRGRSPLHEAAWGGDLERVKLLVELGADPHVRDTDYDGTPMGWAHHNHQAPVVAYLMQFADAFDALSCGGVERLTDLLREERSLANALDARGDPLAFHLHDGIARLPEMIELLRLHGTDFGARDHSGRSLVEALRARDQERAAAAVAKVLQLP